MPCRRLLPIGLLSRSLRLVAWSRPSPAASRWRPSARWRRARARRSPGSTTTSYFQSRSESRSFSSVIIFMYLQIAVLGRARSACRAPPSQPVEDAGLGRDEEAALRRAARVVDHALGREDVRPLVGERHRLAGAAALGMDEQLRVGSSRCQRSMSSGRMPAWTWHSPEPDVQLAPRDLLEPETEEHVGQEQDLAVGRDRLDDGLRVAGRAAVVRLGLHLGRRVDVRDDDRARVLAPSRRAAAPP